jgi:hypothetical protein
MATQEKKKTDKSERGNAMYQYIITGNKKYVPSRIAPRRGIKTNLLYNWIRRIYPTVDINFVEIDEIFIDFIIEQIKNENQDVFVNNVVHKEYNFKQKKYLERVDIDEKIDPKTSWIYFKRYELLKNKNDKEIERFIAKYYLTEYYRYLKRNKISYETYYINDSGKIVEGVKVNKN